MRLRILLAALLLLATLAPASARMHAPYRGHRIVPANAGALDGFTAPSGAYSFRKLRSTYAGPAVKLQRVDTTTQDIGFTATGDFDTAAATAFCTTACTVTTWYDQSGNGRNLVQATAANQPPYVAACIGGRPCFQMTAGTQVLQAASTVTPATGAVSFSGVGQRPVGNASFSMLSENGAAGNRIAMSGVAGTWGVFGGTSGSVQGATATEGGWHALQAVLAGAASVVNIDGVETTGAATGSVTAALPRITGPASGTVNQSEAVFWDNYQLAAGERTALQQNQQNYWIPAPLDSFTQPSGAYSFRKLKSAYAGPALRLRRASDNAELDINFLGCTGFTGCPIDTAAALAHCASTTCFLSAWYDQGGLARDLVQATPANQPQLIFSCQGTLPCARTVNAGTSALNAVASVTPATGVASISVVGNRAVGTGNCMFFKQNGATGNRLQGQNTIANNWFLGAASGNIVTAAADAATHAAMGVVNGASSLLTVDGTTVGPSAITGSVVAAAPGVQGAATTTCNHMEAVVWDNYGVTPAETAALIANQRSFWVP